VVPDCLRDGLAINSRFSLPMAVALEEGSAYEYDIWEKQYRLTPTTKDDAMMGTRREANERVEAVVKVRRGGMVHRIVRIDRRREIRGGILSIVQFKFEDEKVDGGTKARFVKAESRRLRAKPYFKG
jgi:hypothetical protein